MIKEPATPSSRVSIVRLIVFSVVAIPLVTGAILLLLAGNPSPSAKIRGSDRLVVRIPYHTQGFDDVVYSPSAGMVWRESSAKQRSAAVEVTADLQTELKTLMALWCVKVPLLPTPRPRKTYTVALRCAGRSGSRVISFGLDADPPPEAIKALMAVIPSFEP
jgi:hypothetical protein